VKSGVSLFHCVAFMLVSVVSFLWAYKFIRNQRRTDTLYQSSLSTTMIALEDGQTILAVVDRQKSMHFYVGNEDENS
jgi:hypothetical protein